MKSQDPQINIGNDDVSSRQHTLLDAYLKICVRFWALKIPYLAKTDKLETLILKCEPNNTNLFWGIPASRIRRHVRRATRKPYFMRHRRCLREGLLLYRFLTLAGYKPTIHFGIDRTSIESEIMSAHCWVKCDDELFLPPDENTIEIAQYSKQERVTGVQNVRLNHLSVSDSVEVKS